MNTHTDLQSAINNLSIDTQEFNSEHIEAIENIIHYLGNGSKSFAKKSTING